MPAEVLRLAVPERRLNPERTITVAATAERPGRPTVFLMGGPGIPGSVMAPIPPYFTLFQRLRELADVLVVDQRGVGLSKPTLDCPVDSAPSPEMLLHRTALTRMIRERVASCAARLRAEGITIESADDLEALRLVLGAPQIDILAFSYGSRLALMYVQRHGDHVGRLVLQGVNGPGLVLKRPGHVGRELNRMAEILESDSTWHGQADLRAAARAARERLARTPVTVTITDQRTNRPIDLRVGRDGLDAIAHLNLDDARLPALLVSVPAGDDRVLARFAEAAWNGMSKGTAGLMGRAVNCAADRPESRWQVVRSEGATSPFGVPVDDDVLTDDFCRAVGYSKPPVEFSGPVTSSVPVLLLTGSLDATNPIENAEEVARGFSNAVLLEVVNAAHEAFRCWRSRMWWSSGSGGWTYADSLSLRMLHTLC